MGLLFLALGAFVILGLWVAVRRQISTTTVFEYQRGLRYIGGKFDRILEPGPYRYRKTHTTIEIVDTRARDLTVAGQETFCAERVAVKATAIVRFQVIDARHALSAHTSYDTALYIEVQLALREVLAVASIDVLLGDREPLNHDLAGRLAEPAAALGVEVVRAVVRDVVLPADLKRAYGETLRARQESLALIERTRGETAALRSLANAARLVEQSPALLQLRALQALGQSSEPSLVLHIGNADRPRRGADPATNAPGESEAV